MNFDCLDCFAIKSYYYTGAYWSKEGHLNIDCPLKTQTLYVRGSLLYLEEYDAVIQAKNQKAIGTLY